MTPTPGRIDAHAPLTMGQLLCAFAYASDIAFGLQLEDSLRSCYLAVRLAETMGLTEDQCAATYYTALLKDAGCTSWTTELAHAWQTDEIIARRELIIFGNPTDLGAFTAWMRQFVARDRALVAKLARCVSVLTTSRGLFADAFATSAAVARRIALRLGMPESVQTAMLNMFEQWNGSGAPNGLRGDHIPQVSRVVLPTFFLVPVHRVGGRDAAVHLAWTLRGQACDPAAIDAFLRLASDAGFWADLESHQIQETVLAREPSSALAVVGEKTIDDVAFAFADFIDLKSRYAAAHSRRVGAVAEQGLCTTSVWSRSRRTPWSVRGAHVRRRSRMPIASIRTTASGSSRAFRPWPTWRRWWARITSAWMGQGITAA